MTIEVRAATRDDVSALVEFNLAMARETEGKTLDRDRLARGVAAVFADARRGFYLVATQDAHVVGGLMVTYEWSDWRDGDWWWIQSVFVRETHRRLGVYRRLHDEVLRRARAEANVVGIRLYVERSNQRAQQTYRTLGMEQTHYQMFEQPFVAIP